MTPQLSEVAKSISEKYQYLHDAFTDLATDVAHLHSTLDIHDAETRGLFNSLSRILAFSDHVHVALNLMGEDVQAIESSYADPICTDWTEQIQDCFDEWFTQMSVSNSKVN